VIGPFRQAMISNVRCSACHDAENNPEVEPTVSRPKLQHAH
jgi:cytochrome c553